MHTKIAFSLLLCCTALFAKAGKDFTGDSIVYESGTQWRSITPQKPVHCFTMKGAEIWFATADNLFALNTKTNEARDAKTLGLPAQGITSMATDKAQNVWIGTAEQGVFCVQKGSTQNFTKEKGLADNAVLRIYPCTDGSVWVATKEGACRYAASAWKTLGSAEGIPTGPVNDIVEADGVVWLATPNGICSVKGLTATVYTVKNGLSSNNVTVLGYDARHDEVWAVTGSTHVNKFNGTEWTQFVDVITDVSSIMVDSQSRVWFGSPSKGLKKFNGEEWLGDPSQLGITATEVNQLWRDEGGNLFFATEKGVLRMNNPYPF
jgi:ligand-binding sensor domain-containing protein